MTISQEQMRADAMAGYPPERYAYEAAEPLSVVIMYADVIGLSLQDTRLLAEALNVINRVKRGTYSESA